MWVSLLVWVLLIIALVFFGCCAALIIAIALVLAVLGLAVLVIWAEKTSKSDNWYDGSWISVVVVTSFFWESMITRDNKTWEICCEGLRQARQEKGVLSRLLAKIVAILPLWCMFVIVLIALIIKPFYRLTTVIQKIRARKTK